MRHARKGGNAWQQVGQHRHIMKQRFMLHIDYPP
jgi:hypothetical protein